MCGKMKVNMGHGPPIGFISPPDVLTPSSHVRLIDLECHFGHIHPSTEQYWMVSSQDKPKFPLRVNLNYLFPKKRKTGGSSKMKTRL